MANELKHKAVGSVLTQAEFEATDSHALNSQATGDIIYASSSTQLSRLENAADNTILTLASSIPAWTATPTLTSVTTEQVAFPATQVASGDANTLDDYEEGTFTPSIGDSDLDGSGEGQAYSKQVGRYTKIGNRVFFSLRVAISNLGTMTAGDSAAVMGLPFTSNSAADSHSAVHVGLATSMALGTAGYSVAGRVSTNAAYITLVLWDSTTSLTGLLISEVSAGADLVISGHYEV